MGSVSSKGRLLSTMARGPKRHMKRLNAPKHWMLDKMGGTWAPRPSTGPHKLRECLPLVLILRNRLKYALTGKEGQQILMQRLIKIDGKVRTDPNYPVGFMDVISIDKTDEHFRVLFDAKGRFVVHRLNHKNFPDENKFKLCRVQKLAGCQGCAVCGHPRRAHHQVPRPCYQATRRDQGGHRLWKMDRHHQVRGWCHLCGHPWSESGPYGCPHWS